MGRPEPLWQAMNCNTLMVGVGCVLAGISAAMVHGNADFLPSAICVIFVIFAQLSANCYFKYSDLKAHEPETKGALDGKDLIYNNGVDRLLFYKIFAFSMGLFALMAGCCIMALGGIWVLVIGIFVIITAWLLVSGPMPLAVTPWAPVFTFILFGPITVISTCIVQLLHDNPDPISWFDLSPAFYKCILMGFMATNANLAYTYVNSRYSRSRGDQTFTTSFGVKRTRTVFLVNSIISFLIVFLAYVDKHIGYRWVSLLAGGICLLLNIYIWWRMKNAPVHSHITVTTLADFNVLLMGILSIIAAHAIGLPDTSRLIIF